MMKKTMTKPFPENFQNVCNVVISKYKIEDLKAQTDENKLKLTVNHRRSNGKEDKFPIIFTGKIEKKENSFAVEGSVDMDFLLYALVAIAFLASLSLVVWAIVVSHLEQLIWYAAITLITGGVFVFLINRYINDKAKIEKFFLALEEYLNKK